MKFDGQEHEEEDEGLLKPYSTHVNMNPFTVLVLATRSAHTTRWLTSQDLITWCMGARSTGSASKLSQECSVTSELPQTPASQEGGTDTMSRRTKYRVNLHALIPASFAVEVKL